MCALRFVRIALWMRARLIRPSVFESLGLLSNHMFGLRKLGGLQAAVMENVLMADTTRCPDTKRVLTLPLFHLRGLILNDLSRTVILRAIDAFVIIVLREFWWHGMDQLDQAG